jgi:hypothetical protein
VEHPVVRKYLGEGTLGKHHLQVMIERLYGRLFRTNGMWAC